MSISPDELDAISQKVRAAFLEEDAPGYIEALRLGLQYSYRDADYFSLLSALHSLKGGAGIAQFHSLQRLAHSLEDLIQSLQDQSCTDQELAWSLFIRAIEEIDNAFKLDQELAISPELLQTLEEFSQVSSKPGKESVKFRFNLSNTITVGSQVGKCIRGVTQKAVAKFKRAVDFDNNESYTQSGNVEGEALTEPRSEPLHKQPSTTENSDVSPPPAHPQATVASPKIGKILRLPLQQLDQMLELTEELITYNERQNLQQQQLSQINFRLEILAPQFQRIQSSLKAFYDNSIPLPTIDSNTFTTLCDHLRTLQELVSFFKENNTDIDLTTRNLTENQKETRRNLEKLYSALIRSRLVPFKKLAQSFLPYLGQLNRRYGKEIKILIQGGEVLVDQSILEELRSPFNHLINNAFDHGIELPEERIALGKPPKAQILLEATTQENHLIFTIADDGRGIELQKIYHHALQRGLASPQTAMNELSQEEILSFIFQPGFSTGSSVKDLSGRGMGLDIVRAQVNTMRGTIQVETRVGQGTSFTIKLPPSLSFLPLLLCRLEKRIVAIPTTSILEILPYSELQWISTTPPLPLGRWKQRTIPVVHLSNLLQYSDFPFDPSTLPAAAGVGAVVLAGPDNALLIAIVDALISQQKLIVKPLDETVKSPPYLAGYTILASGEIVPVLLPQNFNSLLQQLNSPVNIIRTDSLEQHKKTQTILVAEDSQATRILLEELLKDEGFNIIICNDGQEAIEEFQRRSKNIDLVISDIEMPRIDGFGFLRQVRQVSGSTLPVIILSSRTTGNYKKQAMDLGANAFVSKQALSEKLILTIKQILSN